MYESIRTGRHYAIMRDGQPVRSPLGKPYLTGYRLLADDLCEDLTRFGPPAAGEVSLVALHAAYLDYGGNVLRGQLENAVLARYDRVLDFALDRPQEPSAQAMMAAWFGPVVPHDALVAWLRAASVRQLVSMSVVADLTGSVLIGYRLLRGELPAPRLAAGVRKYGRDRGQSASELTLILEKVRRYAQVPEEAELLAGTPPDLGGDSKGIEPN